VRDLFTSLTLDSTQKIGLYSLKNNWPPLSLSLSHSHSLSLSLTPSFYLNQSESISFSHSLFLTESIRRSIERALPFSAVALSDQNHRDITGNFFFLSCCVYLCLLLSASRFMLDLSDFFIISRSRLRRIQCASIAAKHAWMYKKLNSMIVYIFWISGFHAASVRYFSLDR
jgi:hypothetical protein